MGSEKEHDSQDGSIMNHPLIQSTVCILPSHFTIISELCILHVLVLKEMYFDDSDSYFFITEI